mmetsp:Transcript_49793/g.57461  ORF Transcript_49793/g.57461 Transcript_49793/m.57461 type:complete len:331 (+) Transcript_49793:53-1045(+)
MTIKESDDATNLVEEDADIPTNNDNDTDNDSLTTTDQQNDTNDSNGQRDVINEVNVNGDGNRSSFYNNDDGTDSGDVQERKIQHWKNSDFAVGCVNVTWKDDRPSWFRKDDNRGNNVVDNQYAISSLVCGCLGAGRVGNLAILAQSTEHYEEEEIVDSVTGQIAIRNKKRPKLLWVMGPYWSVNLCITFPLIIGVSAWMCYYRVSGSHIAVIITWSIGTCLLIISLCMISCRNPGILHRHSQIPPNIDTDTEEENWRWNDQARTYRPSNARFDNECQVVIEGFDHTCPWTGTAIGSRNMFWFKIFVFMVCIMLVYTLILAVFTTLLNPFT